MAKTLKRKNKKLIKKKFIKSRRLKKLSKRKAKRSKKKIKGGAHKISDKTTLENTDDKKT